MFFNIIDKNKIKKFKEILKKIKIEKVKRKIQKR